MNSFTFNKIAGAVLGTLLLGFVIIEVSHMFYPSPREHGHVENPGYVVAGMEHDTGHEEVVEVEDVVDLAALMASADADAGAGRFAPCAGCHTTEEGGAARMGPNLWNIVNRPMASVEGFRYSDAMVELGGNWTYERLFDFLENPRGFVPGTNMSFGGIRQEGRRANLIAYLRGLSNSPAALPVPAAPAAVPAESHNVAPADHGAVPAGHGATAPGTHVVEETNDAATEEAVEIVEHADDAAAEAMEGEHMNADAMEEATDAAGDAVEYEHTYPEDDD